MKPITKLLIANLIIFTALTNGNSQVLKSVGIKSGISISNQDWVYHSFIVNRDLTYKSGFSSAITMEFFKYRTFNLVTDLSYVQKGFREQAILVNGAGNSIGTISSVTRFDYLSFCPMLKIRLSKKSFAPYFFSGPRIDRYLWYRSITSYAPIEADINKFTFGLTSGIGMEYKWKSIGLLLEAQHLHDFSHFYDGRPEGSSTFITIDNKAFTCMLGLKYYLSK